MSRNPAPKLLITVLTVAGSGLTATPTTAQEIGAFSVQASSPNPEFPGPGGFGIYGEIEIQNAWVFRLTYTKLNDDVAKSGVVCRVYSPRIDCVPEHVSTESSLGGLRIAAMRSVHLGQAVRLAAGGGLTFNSLSVDAVGESGRQADLLIPRAGQTGFQALITLGVQPLQSIPLRLSGSFTGNWVRFRGCADPEDPTSGYDPFCGTDRFDELQVGASLVLPRMPGW